MVIYIDESIHDKYGFMLLAFVTCKSDPEGYISDLLRSNDVEEYHSCANMKNDKSMQVVRSKLRSYVNRNCSWGVLIAPSNYRYGIADEIKSVLANLVKSVSTKDTDIFIDEGIINSNEASKILQELEIRNIAICNSRKIMGIQLADLVAALCGVRLREKISGTPKILVYGEESGFNPPIEADLGYELWASLRYSMRRAKKAKGENMPGLASFETKGYGFFLSNGCPQDLAEAASSLFGEVYLGCIH